MKRRVFMGLGVASIGAGALHSTGAFSAVNAARGVSVSAAPLGDGLIGIVDQGPVKRNNKEPMVEISNNTTGSVSYEITLDTCSDGTLYDNDGGSGCSVTFTLNAGNSQFVSIEAAVTGTVSYTISTSGSVSLEATRTVESESGNTNPNVRIQAPNKDQDFTAALPQGNSGNIFEIKSVDIRDETNNVGLAEIKYEVREGSANGRLVAEKTVIPPDPDRYKPNGNPAETIEPNSGEIVKSDQLYTLRIRGENNNGDFNTTTLSTTTPSA
ncbi:hypothetical protein [Natronorubrum thiooxidans]|uniref:Uncharacterized protein n=1 Tax=Natronorubrum thiooxidans TaxID=308853 RepID=A0A1N7FD08_9EURY|nr:hypothetical protein [Natronorubrum thiooxidans]SIR98106.1 hypothetical protein SAMN05421752_106201 [Natronorubrum thiooxidans]